MLTPLQEQVLRLVAELEEAKSFALAGGGALNIRRYIDRETRDLDFFGHSASAVDRLAPAMERVLRKAGLGVRTLRSGSGFVRLEVSDGADATEIDLCADFRLLPPDRRAPIATLDGEELAIDKVLAIFGRAEPRDFVDLCALETCFPLDRILRQAPSKDPGFSSSVFRAMLDRFSHLRRDEFAMDDQQYASLTDTVSRWKEIALEVARQVAHDRELDGPSFGL